MKANKLFNNGLSFVVSRDYKLIIPQLDVSKCDIKLFTPNTLNEWDLYCNSFNGQFDDALKLLLKKKYNVTYNNNIFIKIPYNFVGCIWDNYPDLYNCDGEQVLLYLEKTQSKLSDVYIKTSPFQCLINCKITPETFINLSVHNYSEMVRILTHNGETNPIVWCSIACWWNYISETTSQNYSEQVVSGGYGTWMQKTVNMKQELVTDVINNDDMLLHILNTYCCPKLYTRCNWFLMLHSRAESAILLDWINNNKTSVVWDDDLISDTPSYAFDNSYHYYIDNNVVMNEYEKRHMNTIEN